tara:strand:- start:2191 stop:2598 length:408 start_codon:yes stop_codon:yes gene_type:complete
MSYKNFELQLNKELVDTDEKIEDVISLIAMDSLRSIVKMSPVDTGRFRNNWIVSKNRMNPAKVNTVDKTGTSSITRGTQTIETFEYKKDRSIIIQNNLPYANRLENGSSKQAPEGMVAKTLNNMQVKYRRQNILL